MRVFVLGTGRCGMTTFMHACRHLSNFTAGRSSGISLWSARQFRYPDQHIETDPRLTWFAGALSQRYPDAVYIHLRRRSEEVVESLLHRWDRPWQEPFLRAMRHSMLARGAACPEHLRRQVCQLYVEATVANIDTFLARRTSMTLWLHEMRESFPVFLDYIGAEGNLAAAVDEWDVRHNATPGQAHQFDLVHVAAGRR